MTGSSRAISGSVDRVSLGRKAFVRSEETHTAKHTERSRKAEMGEPWDPEVWSLLKGWGLWRVFEGAFLP